MLPINWHISRMQVKLTCTRATTQKDFFTRVMDGESIESVANSLNTTNQSISRQFWRIFLRIQFLSGKIHYTVFDKNYEPICTKPFGTLQEAREQKSTVMPYYNNIWDKVITRETKLLACGIESNQFKLLRSNNIITIDQYLNSKEQLASIEGLKPRTISLINKAIKTKLQEDKNNV